MGRRRARRRSTSGDSRLALLVLFLLLIGAGLWYYSHRTPPRPAPTTAPSGAIRIATWNIQEFSDERARINLVALADIIRHSNFDLVVIQEVQTKDAAVQRLRRQLGEPWRVTISPPAGDGERFAVLYRTDRVDIIDGSAKLIGTGDAAKPSRERLFAREPFMASFRAGSFDFTVITVHLTWGLGRTAADRAAGLEKRRREVEALARYAADLAARGPERDILVLGDFNEQKGHENLHYFGSLSWRDLTLWPTNLSSREIYDHILIDPRHTTEWTTRAGVVNFDEDRYNNDDATAKSEISDHRPAWADFATTGADDD